MKHHQRYRHLFSRLLLCVSLGLAGCTDRKQTLPPPDAAVEATVRLDGKTYELINGNLYRLTTGGGREFAMEIYDVEHIEKSYLREADAIFRVVSPTEKYPVAVTHFEDFEAGGDLISLFEKRNYWTSMTLLSPATPTVEDYVALRQQIMKRKGDFIDNTLSLSEEVAHSGHRSLRCFSIEPTGFGKTSWITKASLDTGLLYFAVGDTLRFSGHFFLKQGIPTSIVDFESSYAHEGPGVRILFSKSLRPRVELKWADKPTWRIPEGVDYAIPTGKWVHIVLEVFLSQEQNGSVKLIIDGTKLIEARGRTLPFKSAIYDRMEVGITANGKGSDCILFVDDIKTEKVITNPKL